MVDLLDFIMDFLCFDLDRLGRLEVQLVLELTLISSSSASGGLFAVINFLLLLSKYEMEVLFFGSNSTALT